jgi:hypothetical protein
MKSTTSPTLRIADAARTDHWRDLGGGLGFVPDIE